jgi:aspartyl/asparaginyl-tRNA synthetase
MFEFEMPGNIDNLKQLEYELCNYMGFPKLEEKTYEDWCIEFGTEELDNYHEKQIDFGMITKFPEHTSPFWNMTRNEDGKTSRKIDVILDGMETIGSAERSTDIDQMRHTFETISDGGYASLLYDLFGKERVQKELDEFLKFDFFPRVGGGIGVTRIISAMDRVKTKLAA